MNIPDPVELLLFLLMALMMAASAHMATPEMSPRQQRARLQRHPWLSGLATIALAAYAGYGLLMVRHFLMVAMPLVGVLCWLMYLLRPYSRSEAFRNYIHEPYLCGRCDYSLTGNVSGICPECGWPIPRDVREIVLQDYDWQYWWKRWHIDYLDMPGAKFTVQMAASLAGIAGSAFCAVEGMNIFAIVFAAPALHFGINALRVWQCRRRLSSSENLVTGPSGIRDDCR